MTQDDAAKFDVTRPSYDRLPLFGVHTAYFTYFLQTKRKDNDPRVNGAPPLLTQPNLIKLFHESTRLRRCSHGSRNIIAVTLFIAVTHSISNIFEIFTQKIDSKFDSTKARQKPDWRARAARARFC